MRALAICVLTSLFLAPLARVDAAVYKYTDENGRTIFVDGESKIPVHYRGTSSQVQATRPATPLAPEGSDEAAQEGVEGGEEAPQPVEPPARTITDRAIEQRARQEAASLDRARAYQTPVMVRGSRVMVPIEILAGDNSAHLMLLLDDKAPNTTIHRTAVQELRFPPGEPVSLPGPGNRAVKAEKVSATLLDIGPFELKDFPVTLITPQGGSRSFDGVLGQDFLKNHPYTVDTEREMLRWQQPGKEQ